MNHITARFANRIFTFTFLFCAFYLPMLGQTDSLSGFWGMNFGETPENIVKTMSAKPKKYSFDNNPPQITLDTVRICKTITFNNIDKFAGKKLETVEFDFNEDNQLFRVTLYFDSYEQHFLGDTIANDLTIKYGHPKNKVTEAQYVKKGIPYEQTVWEWVFSQGNKIICNNFWKPKWTGEEFVYTKGMNLQYVDTKRLEKFAALAKVRLKQNAENNAKAKEKARQQQQLNNAKDY